jgi:hypothetical protein
MKHTKIQKPISVKAKRREANCMLIHTLPLLLRENVQDLNNDLHMLHCCLYSLQLSSEKNLILYNQGHFSNAALQHLLKQYALDFTILGTGVNMGIPRGRQACFEYIWTHYPQANYISEIHVDMIFPQNWHCAIIDFLNHSDEPMLSPCIINQSGELLPKDLGLSTPVITPPQNLLDYITLLPPLAADGLWEGFVHPVIHKASVLKEIGGYDCRYLNGKQCFEDDSLLLGYLYYMGLRCNWKPKALAQSIVYHAALFQRMSTFAEADAALNLQGLLSQYGCYGIKHLATLHQKGSFFRSLYESIKSSAPYGNNGNPAAF